MSSGNWNESLVIDQSFNMFKGTSHLMTNLESRKQKLIFC